MRCALLALLCGMFVLTLCVLKVDSVYDHREKAHVVNGSVITLALLCWPLLWYSIIGNSEKQYSWISLIWPIVILSFELKLLTSQSEIAQQKRSFLNMDSSTVFSLTFAMAGLLVSQHPEKKECCSSLFMYAIVGCLIFVLPVSHGSHMALEVVTLEAVQRVCLTFSTAFLIAGTLHMSRSQLHNRV